MVILSDGPYSSLYTWFYMMASPLMERFIWVFVRRCLCASLHLALLRFELVCTFLRIALTIHTRTHEPPAIGNAALLLLCDVTVILVLHHICWWDAALLFSSPFAQCCWRLFIVFCLRLNAKLKIAPCHAMMIPYGTERNVQTNIVL